MNEKRITKRKDYPLESGYVVQTVMGEDEGGTFYFIAVKDNNNTVVEKHKYRDSHTSNRVFLSCKEKFMNASPAPETEPKTAAVVQLHRKKPNEEAALKLETEMETTSNPFLPALHIVRHLKEKCLSDTDFANMVNDERKTLAKCFTYVQEKVTNALNRQNGWLDDSIVYGFAVTYYTTDEAVFERIAAEKAAEAEKRREEAEKKRKEMEEKRKKSNKKKSEKKETTEKKPELTEAAKNWAKEISSTEKAAAAPKQEQLCLLM